MNSKISVDQWEEWAEKEGWEDEDFRRLRLAAKEEGMLLSYKDGVYTFVEK